MYAVFTYIYHKNHLNVAKNASPMDPIWDMNLKPLKTQKVNPQYFPHLKLQGLCRKTKADVGGLCRLVFSSLPKFREAKGWWLNLLKSPMSKHTAFECIWYLCIVCVCVCFEKGHFLFSGMSENFSRNLMNRTRDTPQKFKIDTKNGDI